MHAGPAKMQALPTVRGEDRAFSSSSLGSFYIGQLRCASAMEMSQLVPKLSEEESVENLALPKLESTKILQQQLSSGGANTALHDELATNSLTVTSLSLQDQLTAAYFQTPSLTVTSLSFRDQLSAADLDKLERSASPMSFQQQSLQNDSSPRASQDQPKALGSSMRAPKLDASDGSTRALDPQLVAFTSSLGASRKQLRDSKISFFPSLIREIVILMILSLILHSLSFLFRISSLNCTSLSFQTSLPIGWARELAELDTTTLQDEFLTTFGDLELVTNKLERTCREEENDKQAELQNLLWAQELEKYCAELTKIFEVKKSKLHSQLSKLELAKLQFHIRSLDKSSSISGDWTRAVPYPELGQEQFHHKKFQSLIFQEEACCPHA